MIEKIKNNSNKEIIILKSIKINIRNCLQFFNYRFIHFYFRSKITDYLPSYACKNRWSFLNVSTKPGPEHRLLDRYRSITVNTTRYKLLRKYMEFCWALPYYG